MKFLIMTTSNASWDGTAPLFKSNYPSFEILTRATTSCSPRLFPVSSARQSSPCLRDRPPFLQVESYLLISLAFSFRQATILGYTRYWPCWWLVDEIINDIVVFYQASTISQFQLNFHPTDAALAAAAATLPADAAAAAAAAAGKIAKKQEANHY